jgi:hypothetical protein
VAHSIDASTLLRLPVRLRGIELGRPVDLLLDDEATRVIGLEVLCGDGGHRFLPLSAAGIRRDEIEVPSPLLLLDERDLVFYRRRCPTLTSLRGSAVGSHGTLSDLQLADDGGVRAFVVETALGPRRISADDGLRVVPPGRVPAA